MNNTLQWRRFSKEDWYGYAGAEPFGPKLAPLAAAGSCWDAVWDANGVEFYRWDDEGNAERAATTDVCAVGGVDPAWPWDVLLAELGLRAVAC